jgi:two-component system LytT family response regulator
MDTQKYKVMMVDDELPALTNMQYALADHADWMLVASCHSTAQARLLLQNETIDLVLLDIEMPTQSGLDFARELIHYPQPPLIVFITAYNKHAVSAFEIFALDYLLKPFDDERFAAMLARAKLALQTKQQLAQSAVMQDYFLEKDAEKSGAATPNLSHVAVRSVGKIERIDIHEIIWLSAAANYVELHLFDRVILHRTTISAMEERLPRALFLRLHRTALVRIDAIRTLEISHDGAYAVLLSNGDTVRVSDSHIKKVKQILAR